jgi:ADP-ribosylglycohydrolase
MHHNGIVWRQPYINDFTNASEKKNAENVMMLKDKQSNCMELVDRYRGCLLGLAVGDALGTTLEFKPPGSLTPITDMIGGGPFNLKLGQWNDDTSMAICLAESLVECRGFNPEDEMERYVHRWRSLGRIIPSMHYIYKIQIVIEKGRDEKSKILFAPY